MDTHWLENYLPVDAGWAPPVISAVRILLILVLCWIAIKGTDRLTASLRRYLSRNLADAEELKRATTLGRVFRYIATVVITLVGGMLLLGELGISVAPILGAAGVLGVAIGFGAQSLVKDYVAGFFLLLENQMRQGDVVQVAGIGGVVEDMNLRYVQLRDYEGNVHFIPNGSITTVTNRTRDHAFAVIDIGIAYRESVDEAFQLMREVATELRSDTHWSERIQDELEIAGVNEWGNSAVMLRARMRVVPGEQWALRREFLKRLKQSFDEHGLEIPFPHMTVYTGQPKSGQAPSLNVAVTSTSDQSPKI